MTLPVAYPWFAQASELRERFERADPFPHLVLDGFLDADLAESLHDQFPTLAEMPKSRDYVFGNKHELSSVERRGEPGRRLHAALTSHEFRTFLRAVTGFDVTVDPRFHGGGFHQSGNKGFLDFHVDFNVHPARPDWFRTLNILIYLNRDWQPSYGGNLLLKATIEAEPLEIAPAFNRAVIMLTGASTYHAVSPVSVPPGRTRKSIAAYAYRDIDPRSVTPRTTGWVPLGAGVVKRVFARYYNTLVRIKTRLVGSGTAKNR